VVYVPDSDWGGQTAFPDGAGEVTFVPDPDWQSQAAASDEPWEVAYFDADVFDDTLEPSL
jgi:hypothetical protein